MTSSAVVCRYWDTRPTAVITRITQLMAIGGSFISGLLMDLFQGESKLHQPMQDPVGSEALSLQSMTAGCFVGSFISRAGRGLIQEDS